jgi:hypothetical protein
MSRKSLTLAVAAALAAACWTGAAAHADTYLPGDASVRYATNVDGFSVNSTGLTPFGATSWAQSVQSGSSWTVQAGQLPGSYADAGIVLGFDGSLTLGQLQSVTVSTLAGSNATPMVNLWLDTGGDDQFFSFTGEQFSSLNGDAYFGATTPGDISTTSTFGFLGGPGSYAQYTLAQLQSGDRAGIDANTKVALWIGVTGGDYYTSNFAVIDQVEVGVAPAAGQAVPLPASAWSGLTLLAGLAAAAGVKRARHQAILA